MYYRRKILLALIQLFNGSLPKIDLQKYLFLFNSSRSKPEYEFIPYKYGCFSFLANQDLNTLRKYNLVKEEPTHWGIIDQNNYINQLKLEDKLALTDLYKRYSSLTGNELIKYVYENFPYYAINSTIAEKLLSENKYNQIRQAIPIAITDKLFTIGYEGKSVEYFVNQLIRNNVNILCDIRKNPLSMKYGFSKNQLRNIIENIGIKYIHIPQLGIASEQRRNLNTKKDYDELFLDYEENTLRDNYAYVKELCGIFNLHKRIALMCFEADPNYCHRSRTAKALAGEYQKECLPQHI